MDNSHEVLSEFLFGCVCCLVENDERCPCALDVGLLPEFDPESRQPVLVGHHNFSDISFLDEVQKPREAFPFVLEPWADVFEDFVVWEFVLERLDLTLEVVLLLSRGDAAVDRALFRVGLRVLGFGRTEVLGWVGITAVGLTLDCSVACDIESALPTSSDYVLSAQCLPSGAVYQHTLLVFQLICQFLTWHSFSPAFFFFITYTTFINVMIVRMIGV
jgi:hypothetical protein